MVHLALRSATRDDQASIDRMLLPFNLQQADDYRSFLKVHLAALSALQVDCRPEDRKDFAQMLCCLRADLEALGCAATETPILASTSLSPPNGLGIGYVVRGSRLGAAALRLRVGADLPTSYLDYVSALSWAEFLVQLESIADDPSGMDAATRAARSALDIFASEFTRLHNVT